MHSLKNDSKNLDIRGDINLGDLAEDGGQLRPDIVWFEEPVPMMELAVKVMRDAEIFAVIGTSLVVYPAAGLVNYAPYQIPKFIIDKSIPYTQSLYNLTVIEKGASEGVKEFKTLLQELK
jgi:NAD-dependent deacetylase